MASSARWTEDSRTSRAYGIHGVNQASLDGRSSRAWRTRGARMTSRRRSRWLGWVGGSARPVGTRGRPGWATGSHPVGRRGRPSGPGRPGRVGRAGGRASIAGICPDPVGDSPPSIAGPVSWGMAGARGPEWQTSEARHGERSTSVQSGPAQDSGEVTERAAQQ
jgi:hypothetical protein